VFTWLAGQANERDRSIGPRDASSGGRPGRFGTLSRMDTTRFDRAIAAIDAANAADPNTLRVAGVSRPKELAHAERVTAWITLLRPDASETLLLAARAHHLRRWLSPRASYPEGRAGYLRWRRDLAKREADDVAVILAGVGYPEATIERVQAIVRKQRLGRDYEVQALEDALCLVFLETQLDELAGRLDAVHMVDVLSKTMGKMSSGAVELATLLPLSEEGRALLGAAARRSSP
jgi:hypothetical protein